MKIHQLMLTISGAGLASGMLLSLPFTGPGLGGLAWVALVPLLLVLRSLSVRQAAAAGLVAGATASLGTFSWLLVVPAVGAPQIMLLGIYLALYPACWCAGVVALRRSHLPLVITAPALWVVLDAVRIHAGFLALPWATLAQSQHDNLAVLQLAAWGGEAAVTFVVVMGNAALAGLIGLRAWRSALAACVTVGLVHASGAVVLARAEGSQRVVVKLAAVQPSIGLLERESPARRAAIWQRLERLTQEAARSHPAVIVWPETAVGDPRHDAALGARLAALSRSIQTPLIVGASETEKFAVAGAAGMALAQRDNYNSAFLVMAGAAQGQAYRKRMLVPFGEYLPLRGTLPWPRWLVPDIGDSQPGEQSADFHIPSGTGPVRAGVLICWENLFADLSREAVQGGAQLLVQLTNDVWFGHTRAAEQHNRASVLRAVENRVPIVIASNTGPSQIIDAHGRVQARVAGRFSQGVALAQVAVGLPGTLFTHTGDLFSLCCLGWLFVTALTLNARQRLLRKPVSSTFAQEAI